MTLAFDRTKECACYTQLFSSVKQADVIVALNAHDW